MSPALRLWMLVLVRTGLAVTTLACLLTAVTYLGSR
jgi:hypothetical protein